jgi:hypothetical protein
MRDGVELGETSDHDNGTWLAVIAGPTAEPCEDPGGIGERAFGVRVRLLCGFAFEGLTDALQGRLVVRIEQVAERAFGFARALGDELHHLDRSDENGGDELFERAVLLLPQGFDSEALCLDRAEQLFDGPAQPIKADDPACVGAVTDRMRGEKEPERGLRPMSRPWRTKTCHRQGTGPERRAPASRQGPA